MIQIILNTIRNQLRKPNWFLFLMVFPMFLIYFISYILTNTFDSKNNLAPVNVCLLDESEGIATATIDTITSASRNITSSYGLIIKPIDSIEQGKIQARINKKVFVHLNGEKIEVYYNENDSVNGSRAIALFQGIVCSYNIVTEWYKNNNALYDLILSEDNAGFDIPLKKIEAGDYLSSFDYFGVAELTIVILYISMIPLSDIFKDRQKKIRLRLTLAGISEITYYLGKYISYMIIASVIYFPSFLFSRNIMKTEWGPNPFLMYVYLMLFASFQIMFGMFLAVFLKERGKIDLILAVVILPVCGFLGGSYTNFPIEIDSAFKYVTLLSPLRWVNLGIFSEVYSHNSMTMVTSSMIFVLATVVMFITIILKERHERCTR